MKFYTPLIFYIIALIPVSSCCPSKNNEPGKPVANIEKGHIRIDSVSAGKKMLYTLRHTVKDFTIDKTEIIKRKPVGEKSPEIFFMQFTDYKKQHRIAKYLFLHKGEFYFFEDLKNVKIKEDDMPFFASYYSVTGSIAQECYPNIAFVDGGLMWIAGNKLACITGSPCVAEQYFVIEE